MDKIAKYPNLCRIVEQLTSDNRLMGYALEIWSYKSEKWFHMKADQDIRNLFALLVKYQPEMGYRLYAAIDPDNDKLLLGIAAAPFWKQAKQRIVENLAKRNSPRLHPWLDADAPWTALDPITGQRIK